MAKGWMVFLLAALLAGCAEPPASDQDDADLTESEPYEDAGDDAAWDEEPAQDDPPPPPPLPPVTVDPGTNAASDAVRAVDDVLAQLDLGNVAFNAPGRVNLTETVTVMLALSPDRAREEVAARITGPGEQVVQSVQVSHLMEARLSGEGFRIVAVTPARQAVGTGITEWAWDITPEAEGRRTLTIALDALIKIDGETVPRSLRTFRHPIDVDVTTGQRLGGWLREHGKWAWGALLLPAFGWWTKRRRDAKAAAGDSPRS